MVSLLEQKAEDNQMVAFVDSEASSLQSSGEFNKLLQQDPDFQHELQLRVDQLFQARMEEMTKMFQAHTQKMEKENQFLRDKLEQEALERAEDKQNLVEVLGQLEQEAFEREKLKKKLACNAEILNQLKANRQLADH